MSRPFQSAQLLEYLKANPFVLAPMAGITDHAFRTFMRELGAGIVVSELISATGIEYKNEKTIRMMGFDSIQKPYGVQIFGEDPQIMSQAAVFAQDLGVDFIDINFGCPVPKVTKKGAGSAALKDLPHLTRVIAAVRSAIEIPLTIKIRTGWDYKTRNSAEVLNIAYNEGVTWVAIHGRTKAQGYSGAADWDYIAELCVDSKVPIIGNGDILTGSQAVDRLKGAGTAGVMIGRGALKNPFIFKQAHANWRNELKDLTLEKDFVPLLKRLNDLLAQRCNDHIRQIQLKKFAAWYATGYPGAAQFRKNLFQSKDTDEVFSMTLDFFSLLNNLQQADTTGDSFLMGGHG